MINSYKITEFLSNNELLKYLDIAKNVGNFAFILKYKPILGDFALFITEQNSLSIKALNKIPSFRKANCIYTTRSLEQSTNEEVALYKATKIKGTSILTLASGLGIDDFAFSEQFKEVISVDNDEILNIISVHNFKLLGINNIIRFTNDAEVAILNLTRNFDSIYLDPDRRNENERQVLLSQHQPNVIQLLPQLLKLSDHIWIKCSPLYDIDMALKEISTISEIYCISLKGEVKEMLLHVNNKVTESVKTICVDIGSKKTIEVEFTGKSIIPELATELKNYFFEAGSTLVKARKHHTYASQNNLLLIDLQVPFYIGENENENFLGKCKLIINTFQFNTKQFKLYLKAKQLKQISIKARGLQIDVKELFKKLEIKEGGEDFFYICPYKGKTTVVHCRSY